MKHSDPDPAETEINEFPELDKRVQPPADADRGLGHNHLAPPPEPHAPELPAGAEEIIEWDENPVEEGHAAAKVEMEDESHIDADLTEEGLDEAERDLRRNARQDTPTVNGPDDL